MKREAFRRVAAPALGLLAVALIAGVVGYVTEGSDGGPASQAVEAPTAGQGARGVVRELAGEQLTLTTPGGPLTLRLSPNAAVEALRPMSPAVVTTGDWLNGGGVANAQTVYTLVGVVVIPQELLEAPSR